ncbi:MAG: LamB/YcsF family protein, partial [Acidobacteriales bacterium]|nr:LamB/YcsF family protein [Terriglobales bacterium]
VQALADVASECGAKILYVKPHGALYNQAARTPTIARAIAEGVARWRREVMLVGLAGSTMLQAFREAGFAVAAEAFADRRYEKDGSLRSRQFENALIINPLEAAQQAQSIVQLGIAMSSDGSEVALSAQTICIHGDTPGAPEIAAAVAGKLRQAGITLRAMARL